MLRLHTNPAESRRESCTAAVESLLQKYIRLIESDDEPAILKLRRSATLQPDDITALCEPGSAGCQAVLDRWSRSGGLLLPDGESHVPELVRDDIGYVLRHSEAPDIAGYASVYNDSGKVDQFLQETLFDTGGHPVNPQLIDWIDQHRDQIAVSREIVFDPNIDYENSPWEGLSRSVALKKRLYSDPRLTAHPYIVSMFLSFRSSSDDMSIEEWNEPSARMTFGCGGKPLKWSQLQLPYNGKTLQPLCVLAFTPREKAIEKAGGILEGHMKQKIKLEEIRQRRRVLTILGGTALGVSGLLAGYSYHNRTPANTIEMADGKTKRLSLLGKTWEYDENSLPSTEGKIVPLMEYGYTDNTDGTLTVSGFTAEGKASFIFSNGQQSLVTTYTPGDDPAKPKLARLYFDGNDAESRLYENQDTLVLHVDTDIGFDANHYNHELFQKFVGADPLKLTEIEINKRTDIVSEKEKDNRKLLQTSRNVGTAQLISTIEIISALRMKKIHIENLPKELATDGKLYVLSEKVSLTQKEIRELLTAVRRGKVPGFLQHGHLLYPSSN